MLYIGGGLPIGKDPRQRRFPQQGGRNIARGRSRGVGVKARDTRQSASSSRLNGSVVSLPHRAPRQAAPSAGALQAQATRGVRRRHPRRREEVEEEEEDEEARAGGGRSEQTSGGGRREETG